MDSETEDYHLEGISLLADSLAPDVEHVAEVVKVAQVGLVGAHGPKILKHVAELWKKESWCSGNRHPGDLQFVKSFRMWM